MISDDISQDPKGYYYAPLTEGGRYQTKLEEYLSNAGSAINFVLAVTSGAEIAAVGTTTNAGGKIGGMLGNTVGFYIDNLSNILNNAETFLEQANSSDTWMMPQPFDYN